MIGTQAVSVSAQTQLTAPAPSTAAPVQNALSSDFETFLLMLITQMENQDPLNPIESADFAVQLATFSGVEQQVQTNALLQSLADGLGANSISQLAGWVGMEARVEAPAYFDGVPISLAPKADPASDAAFLVVRDAAGAVVSREALPLGEDNLLWGGTGASGEPLPAGLYTFEIESLNQGEITGTRPIAHYAQVNEARIGATGIEIVLRGGVAVSSASVTALRAPADGL